MIPLHAPTRNAWIEYQVPDEHSVPMPRRPASCYSIMYVRLCREKEARQKTALDCSVEGNNGKVGVRVLCVMDVRHVVLVSSLR